MSSRFAGPRLKVERAKRHIKDFEASAAIFYQSDPYLLVHETDPENGDNVYRIRINKPMPCEWSAILGDIVHNLRSALDQTVCDLVAAYSGRDKVSKTTGFLITRSRDTFETYASKKIKGVSPATERLIRGFKPYESGCGMLYFLDFLDDQDKHKGIIPVGAVHSGRITAMHEIHARDVIPGEPLQIVMKTVPGGVVFPLTDNAEVCRTGPSRFNENIQIPIEIAVAEAPIGQGQPIGPILAQMVQFIEKGIGILERHAAPR